uniref:(California timema) hypothetical protein n=1 Tax=Timema californicum TaxID=61474 RepID=A0A7R9JGN0_TIMCA|nr:unnamed protein product [Timema californicum]
MISSFYYVIKFLHITLAQFRLKVYGGGVQIQENNILSDNLDDPRLQLLHRETVLLSPSLTVSAFDSSQKELPSCLL